MGAVRSVTRDAGAVVLHGLRILLACWPVLVLIYLLGQIVRSAALWASVVVSDSHHTLGALLVPFAPLATLTALVLMLQAVTPALRLATAPTAAAHAASGSAEEAGPPVPARSGSDHGRHVGRSASPRPRWRDLADERLALLASTLIPFLAVYSGQGYLAEDRFAFVNQANADEFFNTDFVLGTEHLDTSRSIIADDRMLWVMVAVALVLRQVVSRLRLPQRHTAWGLFAAWVEVAWVTLLVTFFTNRMDDVLGWFQQRRFVAALVDWWHVAVSALGPVGSAVDAVRSWFGSIVGDADAVVVVPVAWLTVGAVVYGRELVTPERIEGRWTRWTARVPGPIRRWVLEVTEEFWSRFGGLVDGVRLLARAGLAPMLFFGLVFLLARWVEYGLDEAWRLVLGPRDPFEAGVVSPYLNLVDRGAFIVVMVALLAAAVDRLLMHRSEPAVSEPVSRPGAAGVPGTPAAATTPEPPAAPRPPQSAPAR